MAYHSFEMVADMLLAVDILVVGYKLAVDKLLVLADNIEVEIEIGSSLLMIFGSYYEMNYLSCFA